MSRSYDLLCQPTGRHASCRSESTMSDGASALVNRNMIQAKADIELA